MAGHETTWSYGSYSFSIINTRTDRVGLTSYPIPPILFARLRRLGCLLGGDRQHLRKDWKRLMGEAGEIALPTKALFGSEEDLALRKSEASSESLGKLGVGVSTPLDSCLLVIPCHPAPTSRSSFSMSGGLTSNIPVLESVSRG